VAVLVSQARRYVFLSAQGHRAVQAARRAGGGLSVAVFGPASSHYVVSTSSDLQLWCALSSELLGSGTASGAAVTGESVTAAPGPAVRAAGVGRTRALV